MVLEGIAEIAGIAVEKTAEAVKATAEVTAKGVEKVSEVCGKSIEGMTKETGILTSKIEVIKNLTLQDLRLLNNELQDRLGSNIESLLKNVKETVEDVKEDCEGLTDEEKKKIKEETGWSDGIIDHIDSWEQYEIYKKADLYEAEVDGRKCLLKKDIDMDYYDEDSEKTNRERMEKGRPPIDPKTGERIELHHMGQKFDGPFVELAENSEHCGINDKILHPRTEGSWRNDPEAVKQYNRERAAHWKARAAEGGC